MAGTREAVAAAWAVRSGLGRGEGKVAAGPEFALTGLDWGADEFAATVVAAAAVVKATWDKDVVGGEATADTDFATGGAGRGAEGGSFGAVVPGGSVIGMSAATRGWSTVGTPFWPEASPPVVGAASAS